MHSNLFHSRLTYYFLILGGSEAKRERIETLLKSFYRNCLVFTPVTESEFIARFNSAHRLQLSGVIIIDGQIPWGTTPLLEKTVAFKEWQRVLKDAPENPKVRCAKFLRNQRWRNVTPTIFIVQDPDEAKKLGEHFEGDSTTRILVITAKDGDDEKIVVALEEAASNGQ